QSMKRQAKNISQGQPNARQQIADSKAMGLAKGEQARRGANPTASNGSQDRDQRMNAAGHGVLRSVDQGYQQVEEHADADRVAAGDGQSSPRDDEGCGFGSRGILIPLDQKRHG